MSNSLTYNVNLSTGNSNATLADIGRGVEGVTTKVGGLSSVLSKVAAGAFAFNNISQSIGQFTNAVNQAVAPGIKLDDSLQDLKAITGATDSQLKLIKQSARETATAFGIDAAGGVEAYKLLLSQLSPEIANNPAALNAMGKNVAILSKQLGGDMAGAAGILTTAMNQYGVSLANPIEATKTQSVMMNIMSAAAKEGSAELPAIKSALEQAGMMAKTANVSFAETNSAIQVLDKSGKKGAEGGVAIRNILAEIGLGAQQPKAVAQGFNALGIDLNKLSDKSLSFSQRLAILKPALKDQALLTQYFGKENVAAGIALIQSTTEMDRYTKAIVGTHTATEMADIKMASYQEKMSRYWASVKDIGISIFDSIRPVLPAFQMVGAGTQFIAQFGGMMNTVAIVADSKFGKAIVRATTATWGFVKSLFSTTLSLIRTGVQYIATGAMVVGGFVSSMFTATAAQLGFNVAVMANPIGLIVVGIAAVVGAIVVMAKHWDWIKEKTVQFGHVLMSIADFLLPGFRQAMHLVFDWVQGKFKALVGWVKEAASYIKGIFGMDDKKEITITTELKKAGKPAAAQNILGIDVPNAAQKNDAITGTKPSKEAKQTADNITGGGSKPTNIYVTIGKFQDKTELHSVNIKDGVDDIGRMVEERVLAVLNSINALAPK